MVRRSCFDVVLIVTAPTTTPDETGVKITGAGADGECAAR